jgi:HlyD family secretion protein
MTANVRIMVGRKADALKIPAAALRFRPAEGDADRGGTRSADSQPARPGPRGAPAPEGKVWVLEDGTPKPVTVTLGLKDGNFVEVAAGDLREGQEVLVGGGPREARPAPRRRFFGLGF